jgi:hypothetical protein
MLLASYLEQILPLLFHSESSLVHHSAAASWQLVRIAESIQALIAHQYEMNLIEMKSSLCRVKSSEIIDGGAYEMYKR